MFISSIDEAKITRRSGFRHAGAETQFSGLSAATSSTSVWIMQKLAFEIFNPRVKYIPLAL